MDSKKRIINRISKAIGHLEAIRKMVERDDDPVQILTQLAAVKSAVGSTGKEVLKEYIRNCADRGDEESTEALLSAVDSFIKNN